MSKTPNPKSGEKHIYWAPSSKAWRIQIRMKDGMLVYVGDPFETIPEAVKARDAFLKEYGDKIGAGKDQRDREGFRYIYGRLQYADKGRPYTRYVVMIPDQKTREMKYVGSSNDIQVALAIRDAHLAKQK